MELLESSVVRPRQARYQAALRPDMKCTIHPKALSNFLPRSYSWLFGLDRALTVHLFAQFSYWTTTVHIRSVVTGAISPARRLNLFQGFALHLQLHLGVFLEDLRVSLAHHLSHPLIRHRPFRVKRSACFVS
jgi:hypothetical protein